MGVLRDIKSFVSGKDLIIFSVGLALSNEIQTLIRTLINQLIMPFVSFATGKTNLSSRTIDLQDANIKVGYGAALQATIVFAITLVVMVEIAKYITQHYVKSSSVSFN